MAAHDLQHRRHPFRLPCQQQPQQFLVNRHLRDDVVDQAATVRAVPSRPARRAKRSPLAAEGDEMVVAAVAAAQAQESFATMLHSRVRPDELP